MKNYNEFTEDMKVRQDPDIKDREGTQPAKYYAGDMSKATKQARARHFEKKKSGPAPGDKSAKTKPSKHTLKYRQMFGENKSDKAMMMKLTTKAMKAIPNSPDQKELIKQVNVYRKKLGRKPMKEESIVEREMTDAEMKKREEIVMSLKKKMPEFVKRYGDKAKEVMYATATKMAMGEEEESKSKKKDKINLKPKMDETMKKYKDLLKGLKEKKLDPVNKDAVKKKFKNRKDKDIDNDGDVDSSDEYLHKRRKAISKATGEGVEVDGRKKGYKEAMKRI